MSELELIPQIAAKSKSHTQKNGVEVWSHKLQQKTKERNRKMGLKGDIEALADAMRALKNPSKWKRRAGWERKTSACCRGTPMYSHSLE